jgi:hypothetical protein
LDLLVMAVEGLPLALEVLAILVDHLLLEICSLVMVVLAVMAESVKVLMALLVLVVTLL